MYKKHLAEIPIIRNEIEATFGGTEILINIKENVVKTFISDNSDKIFNFITAKPPERLLVLNELDNADKTIFFTIIMNILYSTELFWNGLNKKMPDLDGIRHEIALTGILLLTI